MASRFVLVRLTRITGVDLNRFEFDYDLNFMVFFLNADEKIYGRYGGRDGKSAEGRLSLKGLHHAASAALETHGRGERTPAPRVASKPLLVEEYPAAKRLAKGTCIHCHNIYEFQREQARKEGTWQRDEVFRYPLPENLGLDVALERGDQVTLVQPGSPAARAGLQPGDRLRTIADQTIASFADIQFALHHAPATGKLALTWERAGKRHQGQLTLREGWRRSNITWRPSLLDILISPPFYGEDLSAAEKKGLGLSAQRLAFRLEKPLTRTLVQMKLRETDIVLGVNGQPLEMNAEDFLIYLRRNFLVGDQVMLDLLREGKKLQVPVTLQ